eukprot:13014719-Alexandrium_andersonii.AAC.1
MKSHSANQGRAPCAAAARWTSGVTLPRAILWPWQMRPCHRGLSHTTHTQSTQRLLPPTTSWHLHTPSCSVPDGVTMPCTLASAALQH